jgi:hypothetical protein
MGSQLQFTKAVRIGVMPKLEMEANIMTHPNAIVHTSTKMRKW